jgi:16S rRNA processing protein RimM
MTTSGGLLEVGRIDKPHGVAGEVVVTLSTNRTERLAEGSVLQSRLGPLTVVRSKPLQHRFIVRFAEIGDRARADAARGVVLSAEPIEDPDEIWIHDLIGAAVVDAEGVARGEIVSVEANPSSDMLVLDTGALVPMRFVVDAPTGGPVVVDPPAGLFELYED